MQRRPRPLPTDHETVAQALQALREAIAKREHLGAGGSVEVAEGVIYSRADLDRLAGFSEEHLRVVGLEAIRIAREITTDPL